MQPQLTSIERLLLEEAAYARAASTQQPSPEMVEAGIAIPVLQPPPHEGAFLFQAQNKPFPPHLIQAVQETMLARPFNIPNPKLRRTPGQPFAGVRLEWIEDKQLLHHDFFGEDARDLNHLLPQSIKAGWLLQPLLLDEVPNNGRWYYWNQARTQGRLPKTPIPQIHFQDQPHPRSAEHLRYCLHQIDPHWSDNPVSKWRAIHYFFDWLLWSLGHPSVPNLPPDRWDGRVHDRFYQVFDASWLLMRPYDYFGHLLKQASGSRPTIPKQIPMTAAKQLAEQLFPNAFTRKSDKPKGFQHRCRDYRTQLLIDPETGSGRILLAASNVCLGLIGTNTHPLLSKAALLNCYFYIPWRIFPLPIALDTNSAAAQRHYKSRAFTLARHKGIGLDYFERTEPAPNASDFLPIRHRRWRQDTTPAKIRAPKLPPQPPSLKDSKPTLKLSAKLASQRQLKPYE